MKQLPVSFASSLRRPSAFSLVELLVVIAIIGILAAMLLPALTKAKIRSQRTVCTSNMKQLQLGWAMYITDNNEKLPANPDKGSVNGNNLGEPYSTGNQWPAWVAGQMSLGSSADNVNKEKLTGALYWEYGSLGPYTKNPNIYHCPADMSMDGGGRGPRVRSVAMNSFMGVSGGPDCNSLKQVGPTYETYVKMSNFKKLSPSDGFVFLDENVNAINDGWFWVDPSAIPTSGNPRGSGAFRDLPAINHVHSSSFSFADGHADTWKWLGKFRNANMGDAAYPQDPRDQIWLATHATARK